MTKPLFLGLLLWLGAMTIGWSQTAPATGVIYYEVSRRLDAPKVIGLDGNEIKPGAPGYPEGIPDILSQSLTLTYGATAAREVQEEPHLVMETDLMPERPAAPRDGAGIDSLQPAFSEVIYPDFKAGQQIRVLSVGTAPPQRFRTAEPYVTPPDWRETGRHKTIAGYRCQEAKATWKGKPCTVWFTTALPFTYSPERMLTPPRGVVIWLQGPNDEYRATRVEARAVSEAALQPPADARQVTPAQLAEEQEKAEADFMRRIVDKAQK